MRTRHVIIAVAALVLSAAGSRAAVSQDAPEGPLGDRLQVGLGTFLTDFETDAAVGSGGLVGTSFNAEDDLDLDDNQSVFRLDGIYRFNERHAIGFGYWNVDREGEVTLDETVVFNGTTYDVGASVGSKFDNSWARLDYRYSALRSSRGEAGFIGGISYYDFTLGLNGEATVSDGMGGTMVVAGTRSEDDLVAPVPTYGLFFNFSILPRLIIKAEASYLDLSVSDIEGKVIDTRFTIDWLFTRHAGIGVGTFGTEIDVEDSGDDPFKIKWDQTGLMAYVKLSFIEP